MKQPWLLGAALWLLPAVAAAQARDGVQVQVDGGLVTFPGAAEVNNGATWGLSASFESWRSIEVEAGYRGAGYTADALVPGETEAALENGLYGAVKLAPAERGVDPYLLAGLGISHINAVDESLEGGVLQDDTVGKLPLGLGVDVELETFSIGLRATYDFVFFNGHALRTGSARGADQFFGSMRLGMTF